MFQDLAIFFLNASWDNANSIISVGSNFYWLSLLAYYRSRIIPGAKEVLRPATAIQAGGIKLIKCKKKSKEYIVVAQYRHPYN